MIPFVDSQILSRNENSVYDQINPLSNSTSSYPYENKNEKNIELVISPDLIEENEVVEKEFVIKRSHLYIFIILLNFVVRGSISVNELSILVF